MCKRNKSYSSILICFILILLFCLPVSADKIPVRKYSQTLVLKTFPFISYTGACDAYVVDFEFSQVKSSNTAIATARYDKRIHDLVVKVKKPGRFTISYIFSNPYACYKVNEVYTVYQWSHPVKSFKIGTVNYTRKFSNKNENIVVKNRPSGKLQIRLGSKYKIESIYYTNSISSKPGKYIKNNSKIKKINKYDEIQVVYSDKRDPQANRSFCIMFR